MRSHQRVVGHIVFQQDLLVCVGRAPTSRGAFEDPLSLHRRLPRNPLPVATPSGQLYTFMLDLHYHVASHVTLHVALHPHNRLKKMLDLHMVFRTSSLRSISLRRCLTDYSFANGSAPNVGNNIVLGPGLFTLNNRSSGFASLVGGPPGFGSCAAFLQTLSVGVLSCSQSWWFLCWVFPNSRNSWSYPQWASKCWSQSGPRAKEIAATSRTRHPVVMMETELRVETGVEPGGQPRASCSVSLLLQDPAQNCRW